MKLGNRYLLTALLGLAIALPVRAQTAANGPGGPGPGPAAAAGGQPAFSNDPPPPPTPNFCPPGETTRNIIYPFGEGTDTMRPVGNAFYDPRSVEGPISGQIGGGQDSQYCYFGLGGIAMTRTTLSREQVAELAPSISYTHQNPVDIQSVPIPFLLGIRAEAGINFGPGVLELSGFYLFPQTTSYTTNASVNPLIPAGAALFGSQAAFAGNPTPAGFSPSLWSTIPNVPFQVTLNYSLAVGNFEMNYRTPIFEHFVLLLGLRYFDTSERVDIQTSDSAGTTDYSVGTRSRIAGPQLGFEYELPLVRHVSVEFTGKAAGGGNFFYVVHNLSQGNGVQGPASDTNGFQPSGLFELGLFAIIWFTERLRLHAGYSAMWIVNVPEAQAQINFNTTVGSGTGNYHGDYFFQGPVIDLTWSF